MAKVMIMDHPLIQHKLTILRNEKDRFKKNSERLSAR